MSHAMLLAHEGRFAPEAVGREFCSGKAELLNRYK
jgi:hypothetical protein